MTEGEELVSSVEGTASTLSPAMQMASLETETLVKLYDICSVEAEAETANNNIGECQQLRPIGANSHRSELLDWLSQYANVASESFDTAFCRVTRQADDERAYPYYDQIELLNKKELIRLYASCPGHPGWWWSADRQAKGEHSLRALVHQQAEGMDSAAFKALLEEVCDDTAFQSRPEVNRFVYRLTTLLSPVRLFHLHRIVPGAGRPTVTDWENPHGRPLRRLLEQKVILGADAFNSYIAIALSIPTGRIAKLRHPYVHKVNRMSLEQRRILYTLARTRLTLPPPYPSNKPSKELMHRLAEQVGDDFSSLLSFNSDRAHSNKPNSSTSTLMLLLRNRKVHMQDPSRSDASSIPDADMPRDQTNHGSNVTQLDNNPMVKGKHSHSIENTEPSGSSQSCSAASASYIQESNVLSGEPIIEPGLTTTICQQEMEEDSVLGDQHEWDVSSAADGTLAGVGPANWRIEDMAPVADRNLPGAVSATDHTPWDQDSQDTQQQDHRTSSYETASQTPTTRPAVGGVKRDATLYHPNEVEAKRSRM